MASAIFTYLQNLWPFSKHKVDDLKVSTQLVRKLSLPEQTKHFVFILREPDSDAVVYILAGQNLSEQSALDAEYLVRAVRPSAVVAQIAPSVLAEIQAEGQCLNGHQLRNVPTSSYEVLKRCFTDKINKQQYETLAGCQVLQEIFGVGFYGHFLAAKKAAADASAHFVVLESPYESACASKPLDKSTNVDQVSGLQLQELQGSCLLPGNASSATYSSFRRFCLTDTLQEMMVKSLTPSLDLLLPASNCSDNSTEPEGEGSKLEGDYQVPPFAQSVYPLLKDLSSIFVDVPSIGKALVSAEKMLVDVNKGAPVNTQLLSEAQNFRVAVEGLRIALNDAGRCPIERRETDNSTRLVFSELPSEEKCHALFAQTLRNQAKKFGSIVAVVDAANLAGIRRHWNTSVPQEFLDSANRSFMSYSDEDVGISEDSATENLERRKKLLSDKPVVAVGAGATAVLGVTSLSKAFPASTLIKVATFKIPTSLKFGLAHLHRTTAIGLSKILGSSKLIFPGVSSIGTKTSTLKLAASAEKIHALTHGMVTSAQRTSLLAIRTSFYEIMRRRHVGAAKLAHWATFGCSMAACAGLLVYGDGIECATESIPSVPMIASLGRGLQSLHQASEEVRQTNGKKLHEALESLIYCSNNTKVNK